MLKKLCLNCFGIYDTNYSIDFCPKALCDATDLIEVDDLMLPVIIKLNLHNYNTLFCCSGHIAEQQSFLGTYIKFTEEAYSRLTKNNKLPPKYWHYDDETQCMRPYNTLIPFQQINLNINKPNINFVNLTEDFMQNYRNKFESLVRILDSLYNWIDKLK